jgi:hypothetical protein
MGQVYHHLIARGIEGLVLHPWLIQTLLVSHTTDAAQMISDEIGRRQAVGIATHHLAGDILAVCQSLLQLLPLIPQTPVTSVKGSGIKSLYLTLHHTARLFFNLE